MRYYKLVAIEDSKYAGKLKGSKQSIIAQIIIYLCIETSFIIIRIIKFDYDYKKIFIDFYAAHRPTAI